MQHQIAAEFAVLLQRDYDFNLSNTYGEHQKLIWILYQTLGPFVLSAFFAEKVHPPGCECEARVDFYVEANGNFEDELKNNLFLYDDYGSSDECQERIARNSIGFDKNCRIRANIREMDLTDFVKKITAK